MSDPQVEGKRKRKKVESRKKDDNWKKDKISSNTLKEQARQAAKLESILFGKSGDLDIAVDNDGNGEGEIRPSPRDVAVIDLTESKKPVWEDEDEAQTVIRVSGVNRLRKLRKEHEEEFVSGEEYVKRLRAQHEVLNRGTSWAELRSEKKAKKKLPDRGSDSDTEESDRDEGDGESLEEDHRSLVDGDELVVKSKIRLPQGLLEVTPMRDGNSEEPSNAVIQSVQFHRNGQILMTAGFDKRLRLFQIDGKRNPKLQSIFLEDFPIHKAAFVPDGSKIVASSRRKHYMIYDMEGGQVQKMNPLFGRTEKSLESFEVSADSKYIAFLGNDGYILLCSLATKQWVANLKLNGSVRSVAFAEDGNHLVSSGGDGEIYHWDLRTRRCFHKGTDEGCIENTSLDVSPNSKLFATGSKSGVVNVYNRDAFLGGAKRPQKTIMNLVTAVDKLKFNSDSQILAIVSRMKKNALKLVHLPSYTVFSNWPSQKTPLHYVHSLDFSPGGGYLALGNDIGRVLLYRLRHYSNA